MGTDALFAVHERPTGARPAGCAVFLQRDLSDQALRVVAAPTFSEAELATARQEAFAVGRAAGLADAAAAQRAEEIRHLGIIAAHLADAQAQAATVTDQAAVALSRTMIAAMQAVMPELIRRSALTEAGAMLSHVLAGLSREAHVDIEIPPEIATGIAAAVAELPAGQRDRITVEGAEGLSSGQVRVRWAAGTAQRHPTEIWRAVMEVLEPALGESPLEGI